MSCHSASCCSSLFWSQSPWTVGCAAQWISMLTQARKQNKPLKISFLLSLRLVTLSWDEIVECACHPGRLTELVGSILLSGRCSAAKRPQGHILITMCEAQLENLRFVDPHKAAVGGTRPADRVETTVQIKKQLHSKHPFLSCTRGRSV